MMNIAVLKEAKTDETRVALRPNQVAQLVDAEHQVYVEDQAGRAAGFDNAEYQRAGGIICDKQTALENGKLILKVKAPLPEEYDDYHEEHILFTYLHLDENISVSQIQRLVNQGLMGIAYEWVGQNKHYPLLAAMSRLTGYLFAQKSTELCMREKGVFIGRNEPMLPGGNVLIIGLGNIGISALKFFLDNNLRITLVEKADRQALNQRLNFRFKTKGIDYLASKNISLLPFHQIEPRQTKEKIAKMIHQFDIVLNCAVRRVDMPKTKLEYLITKEMIQMMQRGSVICDATACDQDMVETAVSSSLLHHTDTIDGIVHYNCDHIADKKHAIENGNGF